MKQTSHTQVFLDPEVWAGNSPDLIRSGSRIDIGAIAESLFLYDKVILRISDSSQLTDLLTWSKQTGTADIIQKLMEQGSLQFYHYAFNSPAIHDPRSDSFVLVNMKEEGLEGRAHLDRYVLSNGLTEYFTSQKVAKRFYEQLADDSIVVDAEDFSPAIDHARAVLSNPESYLILLQDLLNGLQSAGYAIPKIPTKADVRRINENRFAVTVDSDLAFNEDLRGRHIVGRHTPLALASVGSRNLLAAAKLGCDIYSSTTTHAFQNNAISSGIAAWGNKQAVLRELVVHADFPDIRGQVNSGQIGILQVLKARDRGDEFRNWFHTVEVLDKGIVEDYTRRLVVTGALNATTVRLIKVAIKSVISLSTTGSGILLQSPVFTLVAAGSTPIVSELVDVLCTKLGQGWNPRNYGADISSALREQTGRKQTKTTP